MLTNLIKKCDITNTILLARHVENKQICFEWVDRILHISTFEVVDVRNFNCFGRSSCIINSNYYDDTAMAMNHNFNWLQLRSFQRLHEINTSHIRHVARLTFILILNFIHTSTSYLYPILGSLWPISFYKVTWFHLLSGKHSWNSEQLMKNEHFREFFSFLLSVFST